MVPLATFSAKLLVYPFSFSGSNSFLMLISSYNTQHWLIQQFVYFELQIEGLLLIKQCKCNLMIAKLQTRI